MRLAVRPSGVLVVAAVVLVLLAVSCAGGGGGGDTPTAATVRGTPGGAGTPVGAREEPLPFGATGMLRSLEITVDRWELVKCVPPAVTPTPSGEECPGDPLEDRTLRFFVSAHNAGDADSVEGPFNFFLAFEGGGYAKIPASIEDLFPTGTETLGPGETIQGWVYSIRPDRDKWAGGKVRVQGVIGPTLSLEAILLWRVPPP